MPQSLTHDVSLLRSLLGRVVKNWWSKVMILRFMVGHPFMLTNTCQSIWQQCQSANLGLFRHPRTTAHSISHTALDIWNGDISAGSSEILEMSSLTKRSFTLSRKFDPDEIYFKIHLITPVPTFFVIHWSFIIAENKTNKISNKAIIAYLSVLPWTGNSMQCKRIRPTNFCFSDRSGMMFVMVENNDSSFLQQLYPSMKLEFRHIFSQCTAMPQGKYPFQAMHIQTINKTTATIAPTPLKANMFLVSPESWAPDLKQKKLATLVIFMQHLFYIIYCNNSWIGKNSYQPAPDPLRPAETNPLLMWPTFAFVT